MMASEINHLHSDSQSHSPCSDWAHLFFLHNKQDLLAAMLFDMSDGRRGPHSHLALNQ